jgi:UDP-4-amino-4,6-dideoxy-N-acetyl-beta-L-altrosamine transaminase
MISYGRHSINDDDIAAVVAALKSNWLTTGPLVEEFESALEKIVGAPCISVSSGTAALHCAYAAIGLVPGDEVITPPITFVATQATAALFGATIVFADIQPDTANIDPQAVEAAITTRTKAIVAVDYAGHPADLDELRAIADRYGIYLIEDAAHSIGSIYKGRPVGSIADITTFSFFPTKNLTTGEGGAVASIHPELLERAKKFSRQGLVRDPSEFKITDQGLWHQEVHSFGLNYRLPDILCALGVSQLKRLQVFKEKKQTIFQSYIDALSNVEGIELPIERSEMNVNWHLFPARFDSLKRETIFSGLRKAGIGVQVNYIPAYWHPVFKSREAKKGMFPNSDKFYYEEISLPIFADLSKNELSYVCETLRDLLDV